MRTRTKLAIAAALVSVTAFAGVAQAVTTETHPTLSMGAFHADGKVKATGNYDPVNAADCGSAGGKTVTLVGATGSAVTNGSGHYNISTAKLPQGAYTVHTHVAGFVGGSYADPTICYDAVSTPDQTVTIP